MYYVPDNTTRCGLYDCPECGNRFLDVKIAPKIPCIYCSEEPDMELGPDDEMPNAGGEAILLDVIESAEEVEKTDALLSLAMTGGDYSWI